MTPKFSIIIPTYNDETNKYKYEKYLKQCLDSIINYTDLFSIEVIVVANGCHELTLKFLDEISSKFVNFKIINKKEPLGFAKATNLGMVEAKGRYTILMNDDCILLPQEKNTWLDILEKPLADDKDSVISGPLSLKFMGRDFIVGFLMMIKTCFIKKHGYLDIEFTPGWGEDIDLCFRAVKFGYKIIQCGEITGSDGQHAFGAFPVYHAGEATFDLYPELTEAGQKLHKKMEQRILNGFYD